MLSEPAPFLRDPLIKKPSGTTDKIHDHNDYPPYHIPHQKYTVSYFTSPTLISDPPTFFIRGGGGVPGSYDRGYQLFTTKTTTWTTTMMDLSQQNNTRTWLSSRYYNIDFVFIIHSFFTDVGKNNKGVNEEMLGSIPLLAWRFNL
jgi:hypothetical protein